MSDFVFQPFQVNEQNDLPTIDSDTLASLSKGLEDIASLPATTTGQFALPSTPTTVTTPTTPVIPEPRGIQEPQPSEIEVGDEVVQSCVTPRKFLAVKDVLKKEHERHRCALRLLPYFFTPSELSNSNTDGTHNKQPLDSTRLNSLKVLVFTRFPVEPSAQKEKCWKFIKGKINAKCRLSKRMYKQAGKIRDG